MQPSPYDIWATAELVDLVKQRIEITDGRLKASFVVSRAITGSNIGKEVSATLEDYGLPVMNTKISQRVDYPGTAARGSTVIEDFPRSEGTREMLELSAEIESIMANQEAI